jgi:signal transduction histidine kinase
MYEVSEVIFTTIEGLIFLIAFSILSNRKNFIFNNLFSVLAFVFTYTIYTYWITIFIPVGVHTVLIAILTIIILNYIFKGSFLKSAVNFLAIFIVMSVLESLLLAPAVFILKISISELLEHKNYIFLLSLIAKIVETTAIVYIYKKNINISWLQDSNKNQSKYKHVLVIIAAFMFLYILINIFNINNSENLVAYSMFSLLIYLILIIFLFFAFREGSRLEIIQYANELKKENINQLIQFNEMVAKERHEYKNHLNTIYGLCTLNKQDLNEKIKQYINSYANNSLTQNICISSGNDFVDAIVNVKYNNALKKGIQVKVNFDEPLSAANISEDCAVTIISNIIENAFESISNSEQNNKYVKLETYIQNDTYYISISNNGPMIPESEKRKIFNAGYSTKDNSSFTRGFGLSIVQAQLDICGGKIFINSTEEVTEFLVTLKANEQKAAI